MRVALFLHGIGDLSKSGGAERFFLEFYKKYNLQQKTNSTLYLLVDNDSYSNLFKQNSEAYNNSVLIFKNIHNRFKSFFECLQVFFLLLVNRIDLVHVANYGKYSFPLVRFISSLPTLIRPKLVINIVDCEIPYALSDNLHGKYHEYHNRYDSLFQKIKVDGVYSWYKLFIEYAFKEKLFIKGKPIMHAISSRFSLENEETKQYIYNASLKRNEIVWAARFVVQKRPYFFLDSIKIVKEKYEGKKPGNWKFTMFGFGPMENEIKEYIVNNHLEEWVNVDYNPDLKDVLIHSKCFVSTQDYENFPSMSMMEAMALGNVIISRNVGQTSLMIKDNISGFLLKEDTSLALAHVIKKYIENESDYKEMGRESIRLTKEVHTPSNFIKEIDEFWSQIVNTH